MIKTYLLLIFLSFFALLCVSCSEGESKELPNGCWLYGSPIDFSYENSKPSAKTLTLKLAADESYPYQNVWILTEVLQPDGKKITGKPSEFIFMNPEGEWNTEKNFFDSARNFEVRISDSLVMNQIGTYEFTLTQFMRTDTLKGIRSVGWVIKNK